MIVRKFSTCSVHAKNQLFRSYISCLYCCALCLKFSTAAFNMTRIAYNNVYRALMGLTRGYGHSISSEYCTNSIDRFEAVLRKMISSLGGRLHECKYCCGFLCVFPVLSPLYAKWNVETLIL